MKGEIIYHGGGGRGGSLASFDILTKVIENTGVKSTTKLNKDIKKIQSKGLSDYKKGIDKLNIKYDVKSSDLKTKLKNNGTTAYAKYQDERAMLSRDVYIGPIIKILDSWLKENNKNVKPSQINDASRLLLSFIKYTSSRSMKSGKFVIAK